MLILFAMTLIGKGGNSMKKFISVLMAALMLFSFASCKGSENEGEPDAGEMTFKINEDGSFKFLSGRFIKK